jgi:ABC-type glycerol-3-phosphate transport system substrate-binding protein
MRKAVSKANRSAIRLVLVCCLLVSAACGGGDDGGGVVKVTFWHAMGGPLGRVLTSLIDEFNETHPDIEIVSVSMGRYTALSQKIMAAVAAGKPPVIAQAYENWTIELILSGSIVPIQTYFDGPNGLTQESLDDILPVFIENNTWDDVVWSFPFNKSVRTLFYNKDLFERSGLDRKHPPRNWEEYLGFSRQITKDLDGDGRPDIWGTAGQVNVWMFSNLLLQNGGSFMDASGQRVAFNGREGEEALAFMEELLAGDVGFIASGYEYQNDFLADKVGMMEGSTVSLAFIKGKFDFELGIAPLPAGKVPGVTIAGTNVVMFAKASPREQAAAWTFIKWFTDTRQTARWAAGTGYVPVRRSAFETDVLREEFEQYPGLRDAFSQLEYASFEPKIAGWYAGRRYLGERAIEAVLRGDTDIKEALDRAASKANAEIARLKRLQEKLGLGETG